jgi:DNA-binding NarL/FixJ family response regulator/PAS domain-containing protein
MTGRRLEAFVKVDEHGRVVDANWAAQSILGVDGRLEVGRPLADLLAAPETEPLRVELAVSQTSEPAGATVLLFDVAGTRTDEASIKRRLDLLERAERVAGFGSFEFCPETGKHVWSDNLYRLWQLEPGEVTPSLEYVMERTHPDDRTHMAEATELLASGGHLPPFEFRIVQRGRPTRRLLSTIAAIEQTGNGHRSVIGVVRDVTDEVQANRKIAAHVAVSNALEDWESLELGAQRLLRDLAEALEFDAGCLWVPRDGTLTARVFWAAPSLDASAFESVSRRLRVPRGSCLPGMVWEAGEPINLVDVRSQPEYGRGEAAAEAGLHGAVALPAMHADEVLAVVELHSRDPADLSSRLMRSLRAIGYEIGQFLAHRRVDLDPICLTPRQLEVMQLAAEGCSGREIADRLFISPTTVKSHFENVYAKFGVSDRTSAVAEAMRYGLIA